ncbi:GroES-like protein [Clavulina sp. PMI_390]|nr:GroES-like protein [Clavulina sp. PMI_390]
MSVKLPETQKAVFLSSFPGTPEVKERPIPQTVSDDEVLVKIRASAMNQSDNTVSRVPFSFLAAIPGFPQEPSPLVLGSDMAGEVVLVGSSVTNLKVGDRIFGGCRFGKNDYNTFQEYYKLTAKFAMKIPPAMSFEAASTVYLAFSTVVTGMYLGSGLTPPWAEGGKGKYSGHAIVIAGASSSVGQYGIQLARLSGFSTIIATASDKHTRLLKAIGATHVVPHTTMLSPSSLSELSPSHPILAVCLAITKEEYLAPALEVLPNKDGAIMMSNFQVVPKVKEMAAQAGKEVHVCPMMGSPNFPQTEAFLLAAYSAVEKYLETGDIVPNEVVIVEGGLAGIPRAFDDFQEGRVSGVKLVARIADTPA